jgi:hypothetical protein
MGFVGAIITVVRAPDGQVAAPRDAIIVFALLFLSGLFGAAITAALLAFSFGHLAGWVWTLFIGLELLSASFIAGALLRTEPR